MSLRSLLLQRWRLTLGLLLLGMILLGIMCRPDPPPDHRASIDLQIAFDSLTVARERLERLLADSTRWQAEVRRQDSLEADWLRVADSTHRAADELRRARLSLRGPRPALLPRIPPADTTRLLAELDTVSQERDLAVQEADTLRTENGSLRTALAYADSGKASLTASIRQIQLGANNALASQILAEGILNQTVPLVREMETKLANRSRWHLGVTGGAVGGFDTDGPFYGPGAGLGATLSIRLPLLHWRVGLTVGGVGAFDLARNQVRLGLGGSAGLSVRF